MKTPVADLGARHASRLDLGVGRGVAAFLSAVAPRADYPALGIRNDAADGDLPRLIRLHCKRKGLFHVSFSVHKTSLFKKRQGVCPVSRHIMYYLSAAVMIDIW